MTHRPLSTDQMSSHTRILVGAAHSYQRVPFLGEGLILGASFLLHGEAVCRAFYAGVLRASGSQNARIQIEESGAAYRASMTLFFSPFTWRSVPQISNAAAGTPEPMNAETADPSQDMIFPPPGNGLSVTPREYIFPIVGANFDGRSRSTSAASVPAVPQPVDEIETPRSTSSLSTFIDVKAPEDPRQAVFAPESETEESLRSRSQLSFEVVEKPQDPRQEALQRRASSAASCSDYSVV